MREHDERHTNATSAIGPTTPTVHATMPLTETVAGSSTVAIAADGTVYVAEDQAIHAREPDLTSRWTVPLPGWSPYAPAIRQDGSIVVAARSPTLPPRIFAISPTGTLLWSADTQVSPVGPSGYDFCDIAIGCDESAYVLPFGSAPADSLLHAFDAHGALRWTRAVSGVTPAVGPLGTIYTDDGDAVNPDGSVWYSGRCAVHSIGSDGTLFGYPRTCSPDGATRWTSLSEQSAVGVDGTSYFQTSTVQALDANGAQRWTAGRLWTTPCRAQEFTTNIVIDGANTAYYAGGYDGRCEFGPGYDGPPQSYPPFSTLYVIDGATGSVGSTVDLEGAAQCQAWRLAIGDRRVYVVCFDKLLELE
jgi:hypothetical protein